MGSLPVEPGRRRLGGQRHRARGRRHAGRRGRRVDAEHGLRAAVVDGLTPPARPRRPRDGRRGLGRRRPRGRRAAADRRAAAAVQQAFIGRRLAGSLGGGRGLAGGALVVLAFLPAQHRHAEPLPELATA